ALKFTFEGEIEVTVSRHRERAELSVRDTGTGIPPAELPHIFERFHRVHGGRARTLEGSGIGLALVEESTRLHGGTVGVQSEVGNGTTFTVSVPFGRAHLPADKIRIRRGSASSTLAAAAFLEEAVRWLPERPGETLSASANEDSALVLERDETPERILLADANPAMRE